MNCQDAHDRILATLWMEFRNAGRGSITAAEKRLGLYPGFYRKTKSARNMRLLVLTATLEHLGVELGAFFARAFSQDMNASDSDADTPQKAQTASVPYRPTPAQVEAALEFFEEGQKP